MRLNITAGQCLNEILTAKYPSEQFVPFNEAMIKGTYTSTLFSPAFMEERAAVHGVTVESYKETLSPFVQAMERLSEYDEAQLWFGEEPFCMANRKTVIKVLNMRAFRGKIICNTVDELTGEIQRQETIQ